MSERDYQERSLAAVMSGEARCAFLFAHYDDSVFDAFHAMAHASGGAIDIVLCTECPRGRWGEFRRRSLPPALRNSLPVKVAARFVGRPVFAEWDYYCGLALTPAEVIDVRRAEHAAACAAAGVPTFALGDYEVQYSRSSRTRYRHAVDAATALLRDHDVQTIVTHPASARHPDHRRTHRLAQECRERTGVDLVTVCERPYTVCSEADGCREVETDSALVASLLPLADEEWAGKLAATNEYRTQIGGLEKTFGSAWMDRDRLGVECYHSLCGSQISVRQ